VTRSNRIRIIAAIAVLAAPLASGSSAHAGPLVSSAPDCKAQQLEQTFWPWADPANYTPLPGGNLENGARGWRLQGGATVVAGSSPYKVGDDPHQRSLALPEGSVATSPAICVSLVHPTIRFFAKRMDRLALTTLVTVEVLFEDALGNVLSLPIGLLPTTASWQPTLPVPIVANLLPLLPDERTAVGFRFGAVGGDAQLDDIWVDPWRMR